MPLKGSPSGKEGKWASGYNEIAMKVSVAEAKNRLPELIKAVENGEAVTICRRGKPVVELVRRSDQTRPEIEFGGLGHLNIELDPDWWKPMTKEEAEAFLEGR
jgi:prevent-host-death family protein